MSTESLNAANPPTTELVRSRVQKGGERVWKLEDFDSLPPGAVAQALSRLCRKGVLERVSKGIYYRPRKTAFGASRPNPAMLRKAASQKARLFPAGTTAANRLGFTTQNPARVEMATTARSVPKLLQDENAIVHTRRPAAWETLSEDEAALLEFLRMRGEPSELPTKETIKRLVTLLAENNRFSNLVKVAPSEPPRVRAMLGALGEELGADKRQLDSLRDSLNPLTRFDFGMLVELESASRWQAKERSVRETI
ncbi:MAG: hypothetical protein H6822_19245 [Planctomycetaceae bacterium]|nr:hypothetical protein [Planctomycetales bacterium]MCB9924322.1 hypothetical protein [Planctomycetaceae bacterium]